MCQSPMTTANGYLHIGQSPYGVAFLADFAKCMNTVRKRILADWSAVVSLDHTTNRILHYLFQFFAKFLQWCVRK